MTIGASQPRTNSTFSSTTAPRSADLTKAAATTTAGTGPPCSTRGGPRGASASVTDIRAPAPLTLTQPCDASVEVSGNELKRKTVMTQQSNEPKIGNKMPDGTIYAGVSPDTGSPIYAMPTDAPRTLTFNEAADHAKKLNREKYLGYDDWRLPTKTELNVLFNNRAAIGGFDISDSLPTGWYWSSSQFNRWDAWG